MKKSLFFGVLSVSFLALGFSHTAMGQQSSSAGGVTYVEPFDDKNQFAIITKDVSIYPAFGLSEANKPSYMQLTPNAIKESSDENLIRLIYDAKGVVLDFKGVSVDKIRRLDATLSSLGQDANNGRAVVITGINKDGPVQDAGFTLSRSFAELGGFVVATSSTQAVVFNKNRDGRVVVATMDSSNPVTAAFQLGVNGSTNEPGFLHLMKVLSVVQESYLFNSARHLYLAGEKRDKPDGAYIIYYGSRTKYSPSDFISTNSKRYPVGLIISPQNKMSAVNVDEMLKQISQGQANILPANREVYLAVAPGNFPNPLFGRGINKYYVADWGSDGLGVNTKTYNKLSQDSGQNQQVEHGLVSDGTVDSISAIERMVKATPASYDRPVWVDGGTYDAIQKDKGNDSVGVNIKPILKDGEE